MDKFKKKLWNAQDLVRSFQDNSVSKMMPVLALLGKGGGRWAVAGLAVRPKPWHLCLGPAGAAWGRAGPGPLHPFHSLAPMSFKTTLGFASRAPYVFAGLSAGWNSTLTEVT